MARLGNIQEYEKRKAAATPVGTSPQSQSVREGFQQMAQKPMEQPVLQKVDANKVYESTRSQALGSDAAQVDPQKTMESWNASPYEYWTEQVKTNPESTYAIVNQMFASKETPEEKAKRERREQLGEVFNNLGNLIGNAANLYYTHRGGQYIDLNTANEKHRERMQRIKDKQDALDRQREQIVLNAKLGDAKTARAEAAVKAKNDAEAKRAEQKALNDRKLAEIKYLQELGVINAKQAGELEKIKTKAEYDEKLAKIRHGYNVALKSAPTYSDTQNESKIYESAKGDDGNFYTRNTKLSPMEYKQIAMSNRLSEDATFQSQFRKKTTDSEGKTRYGDIDYEAMGAYLLSQGLVPKYELLARGFSVGQGAEKWKPDYDEEWTSK